MDGDAFWLRVTSDPDPEEPTGAQMFERRRAVLSAAAVGYLLSGFLLALTAGSVQSFYANDVGTGPSAALARLAFQMVSSDDRCSVVAWVSGRMKTGALRPPTGMRGIVQQSMPVKA